MKYKKGESYKKYDLTKEEYDALLIRSSNKCEICGTPPKVKNLCIDHDHSIAKQLRKKKMNISKSVRGLVCNYCNRRILSNAADRKNSIELFLKAAEYIANYRKQLKNTD